MGTSENTKVVTRDLQTLFNEFIFECGYAQKLQPETLRGYREAFELFVKLTPNASLEGLTSANCLHFFKTLQHRNRIVGKGIIKTGVKNSTIITYRSKLNSFFEWLHRKSLLSTNPLASFKPPKLKYEDQRALTDTEIQKLYAAVTLHAYNTLALRRNVAMVSLLFFCGLRLGEFISLEIRDIDMEKRLLTVRGTTSKSGRVRHLPIHPTLLFHLQDYLKERRKHTYTTQYLLVSINQDRGLSRNGLKHWVKNISEKSGVKFHLHQFRHSFACNLAENDVNPIKIQRLLGHSSLNMTMTYLRSLGTENLHDDIHRLSI